MEYRISPLRIRTTQFSIVALARSVMFAKALYASSIPAELHAIDAVWSIQVLNHPGDLTLYAAVVSHAAYEKRVCLKVRHADISFLLWLVPSGDCCSNNAFAFVKVRWRVRLFGLDPDYRMGERSVECLKGLHLQ